MILRQILLREPGNVILCHTPFSWCWQLPNLLPSSLEIAALSSHDSHWPGRGCSRAQTAPQSSFKARWKSYSYEDLQLDELQDPVATALSAVWRAVWQDLRKKGSGADSGSTSETGVMESCSIREQRVTEKGTWKSGALQTSFWVFVLTVSEDSQSTCIKWPVITSISLEGRVIISDLSLEIIISEYPTYFRRKTGDVWKCKEKDKKYSYTDSIGV